MDGLSYYKLCCAIDVYTGKLCSNIDMVFNSACSFLLIFFIQS